MKLRFDKAMRVKAHLPVCPARHAQRTAVAAFLAGVHREAASSMRAEEGVHMPAGTNPIVS